MSLVKFRAAAQKNHRRTGVEGSALLRAASTWPVIQCLSYMLLGFTKRSKYFEKVSLVCTFFTSVLYNQSQRRGRGTGRSRLELVAQFIIFALTIYSLFLQKQHLSKKIFAKFNDFNFDFKVFPFFVS